MEKKFLQSIKKENATTLTPHFLIESDSELSEAHDSCDDIEEEQKETAESDEEMTNKDYCKEENDTRDENFFCVHDTLNIKPDPHDGIFAEITRNSSQAQSVMECWQAFFNNDILAIIVESTNKCIQSKRYGFKRDRDCKFTDIIELKALIGLLYMAGFYRHSKLNTQDLWNTDGSGIEFFRLIMSNNRFHFLLQNMRFDNKTAQEEKQDKLAPIRDVFNMFIYQCQQNYSVGEYLTVDDILVKFKGTCSFRQYIPDKPGKQGIKVFALVDAQMFYTLNLEVYMGAQPKSPFKDRSTTYIQRLCKPISGSRHNVTGNGRFTTTKLIQCLLADGITYMGLIKSKKQEPLTNCESSISYVRQDKNHFLLSSKHSNQREDEDAGTTQEEEMVACYNSTKSAVDVVNKLCSSYSVSRNSNRWPMALFYTLLNIAVINAQIVYKANKNPGFEQRRYFIKALALELSSEHMRRRSQISSLSRNLRKRTAEVSFMIDPDGEFNEPSTSTMENEVQAGPSGRKRCYICDRKKNRKTKYTCLKCNKYICLKHANYVCVACNIKCE